MRKEEELSARALIDYVTLTPPSFSLSPSLICPLHSDSFLPSSLFHSIAPSFSISLHPSFTHSLPSSLSHSVAPSFSISLHPSLTHSLPYPSLTVLLLPSPSLFIPHSPTPFLPSSLSHSVAPSFSISLHPSLAHSLPSFLPLS